MWLPADSGIRVRAGDAIIGVAWSQSGINPGTPGFPEANEKPPPGPRRWNCTRYCVIARPCRCIRLHRRREYTQTAPDFSLIDATGKRVTLSRLKGRVVLLDFWATWCAGCKEEMPWFVEFQARYEKQGL